MKFRDIIRSTEVWWRNQANYISPHEDFLDRIEKHIRSEEAVYVIRKAQKLLPKAPRPEGGAEAQPVGPLEGYQLSDAQKAFMYDESEPF